MKNQLFKFLLKGLLCSLTLFSFQNPKIFAQIYSADFSSGGEGFPDHTTGSPPAAGPAAASGGSGTGMWTASYASTPTTDGSANEFSVNAGAMRMQDWGGTGNWESASIDISSVLTLDIAAIGSTLGNGINNPPTEFFEYYYSLDGGAQVTSSPGEPGNYSVTSLDVSSANSIVVGFNFNVNGGGDGFEISSFTVTATVLPIELSSYTAHVENNNMGLNWTTQSELSNSHFTIEHSTSGRDFQPIGEVKGAGTSLEEQHYSFIHKTPTPGKNYYRLRQTDFDGQEEIHKTIVVEFGGETNEPLVFPTVVSEELSIKWSNKDDISEGAIIRISDYSGRLVFAQQINGAEERFDVSFLSQGLYFVNISDGQFSHVQKIVKK